MPKKEEDLYNNLVCSAPDVYDIVEELDEDVDVEPPATEKVVPLVKGKKGKKGHKGHKDCSSSFYPGDHSIIHSGYFSAL